MGRQAAPQAYIFGNFCFVPSPMTGLWVRTHVSVAFVPCPWCKQPTFSPCVHKGKVCSWAHVGRREEGKGAIEAAKARSVMHALPEVTVD